MAPIAKKQSTKSSHARKERSNAEYQKLRAAFVSKKKSKTSRGRSVYWFKQIHKSLMTYRREPQHGFWNPSPHFKNDKALAKFYLDDNRQCQYLGNDLHLREYTANYLIGQVLAKYKSTESTIVKDGFRTSSLSSNNKEEEDLLTSIHYGAMQEDGRDLEIDENGDEVLPAEEDIKIISQTLISASPNCLGPPLKPCVQYLKLVKVRDRGEGLSSWRSPFLPRMNGKSGNKALLDNQVTAIVWILSRYGQLPVLRSPRSNILPEEKSKDRQNRERLSGPKYRGGILADVMGLGKTVCAVSSLAIIASQGINISTSDSGEKIHSPMLLLVPASVIVPWVKELLLSTDSQAFSHIITSGIGLDKTLDPKTCAEAKDSRLQVLCGKDFNTLLCGNSHIWDTTDTRASHTILVVPIDTWAGRTVQTMTGDGNTKFYQSKLAKSAKRYSVVAVDEAHKVKNQTTRMWHSVDMLERDFTLLITATPCINSITDLFALGALLKKAPEEYVNQNRDCVSSGLQSLQQLEGLEPSDPLYLIAGHLPLLGKLTNNGRQTGLKVDIQTLRNSLKYFERLAILQRAPTSRLNLDWDGKETLSLKGLFPKVKQSTILIQPDPGFASKYQSTHYKLLMLYLQALRMMYKDKDGNMRSRKSKGTTAAKSATKKPAQRKRKIMASGSAKAKAAQIQDDPIKDENEEIKTEDNEANDERGSIDVDVQLVLDELLDKVVDELDLIASSLEEPEEVGEDEFLREELLEGDSHLTRINRNLTIASASLDVLRLQHLFLKNDFNTRADSLGVMRRNGVHFMDIAPFLVDRGRKRKDTPKTAVEYLAMAVRRSPILRQILAYIKNNIVNRDPGEKIRKLLITEDIPVLAWYYEIVLQFAGFNCRVLHSDLTNIQRQELVEDFNSPSSDSCQILIQMYKVGAVGTNLHHNCSRVIVASQSHSLRMQSQAIHRVIRFGQENVVQVARLMVNNSFHAFQEGRQVDKLLPELSVRAQQKTNEDLVLLLNLMQHESYQAWDKPEAKELIRTKKILSDNYLRHQAKKREEDRCKIPVDGWHRWGSTEYEQRTAFLRPCTRSQYYDSYKDLNRHEKLNFDHDKNGQRRLMMYSGPHGKKAAPFTIRDLSDRHLLERALELQIRILLGTDQLAMLPIPQINLPSISQEDLERLADELDEINKLEHDDDSKMQDIANTDSTDTHAEDMEGASRDGFVVNEDEFDMGGIYSDSSSDSMSEDESDDSDDSAHCKPAKRQRISQAKGKAPIKGGPVNSSASTKFKRDAYGDDEPDLSAIQAYNATGSC
ncbi:SNF2-related protein [Microdochium nivale]|nr:SNF2-related protein [Microdochium nivale]